MLISVLLQDKTTPENILAWTFDISHDDFLSLAEKYQKGGHCALGKKEETFKKLYEFWTGSPETNQ